MAQAQKRTILITGCSEGGAGHALALEFAARGFRVFATARSTKSLTTLESKGIETLALDVTDESSIASLKAEISTRTSGKLDILFNNAGTMIDSPAIEASPAEVQAMFHTNVFGLFNVIQSFTPLLLAAVHSSSNPSPPTIINTASVVARVPMPLTAHYNASKAAVASYSDTLRLELAPLGIKVVTLFMGVVSTNIVKSENISFPESSLYKPLEQGLRNRSVNHLRDGMTTRVFAKQVVDSVLKSPGMGKAEYLWKGGQAGLVWALDKLGWRKVFDGNVLGGVGLTAGVGRAIFERGRVSVVGGK